RASRTWRPNARRRSSSRLGWALPEGSETSATTITPFAARSCRSRAARTPAGGRLPRVIIASCGAARRRSGARGVPGTSPGHPGDGEKTNGLGGARLGAETVNRSNVDPSHASWWCEGREEAMYPSVDRFIAAGSALQEENPQNGRGPGAEPVVAREVVVRQPGLAGRVLQRAGALLIVSGQRLQGYGQPRGYTSFQV